jgi:hypothetical protein
VGDLVGLSLAQHLKLIPPLFKGICLVNWRMSSRLGGIVCWDIKYLERFRRCVYLEWKIWNQRNK